MSFEWSEEFTFTKDAIREKLPPNPGVYQILQSTEYSRYEGATRVLEIGMSKSNLRQELLNHLDRHIAANRLSRIRNRRQVSVTMRFTVIEPEKTTVAEKKLLREFEDKHWDLPVLNAHRGYKRGEDCHFQQN